MLGTIACAMCKEKGAAEIIAIDVNEQRLAEAKPFGITRAFNPADPALRNLQADITIDYSGHLQAMAATLDTLAIGGTAVWVGGVCPQPRLPIDTETVIRRLLTIRGLHNYNREDFREAVAFMTAHHGDYPIASLVHDGFDLDHAEEAFRYAIEKNPYRVGIRFR